MEDDGFLDEVENAIKLYEAVTGYPATRTRQMIAKYGVIAAISRLVNSSDLQKGFTALRDTNQLDFSFEALVVKYCDFFDTNTVTAAKWRLAHPFDLFLKKGNLHY